MTQPSARHIRFKGRSFPVLTLEPEQPLDGWIEGLDALLAQSPGFFARKSIVLDLAKLEPEQPQIAELLAKLGTRGVRVMGLSGVDPAWASDDLPPILSGGRATANADETNDADGESNGEEKAQTLSEGEKAAFQDIANALSGESDATDGKIGKAPAKPGAPPLIVIEPVRSGQTIYHPEGDVTVIGSVASGAEIMAGGSVHIYGTLRGRAMAGAYGEKRARIFCRRLEAELLSVCGVYLTADEIAANVQSQPIQAWLENETVKIARLD